MQDSSITDFFQERNSTLQSFLAAEKNQVPNYDYQQKLENETLENLYSPSYWSKRLSQDVSLSRNNILYGGRRGGIFAIFNIWLRTSIITAG